MVSAGRLSDIFVDIADTLVDDFDLLDFLHNVAGHAATITDGSAVGLMLVDEAGRLRHVAGSSEDARLLELMQVQHAEGPCVACLRAGREVTHEDLALASGLWPAFAPRAAAMGFGSVHAFPMRLREDVIGVVNVFRDGHEPLAADEARLARALSDIATIALMQQRAITRAEALAEQLQAALDDRIVIEQAKGAVARSFGIDVDEAFDLVRAHARRTRRRLTDVARDLVSDHGLIATLRTVSVRRTGADRPATE